MRVIFINSGSEHPSFCFFFFSFVTFETTVKCQYWDPLGLLESCLHSQLPIFTVSSLPVQLMYRQNGKLKQLNQCNQTLTCT